MVLLWVGMFGAKCLIGYFPPSVLLEVGRTADDALSGRTHNLRLDQRYYQVLESTLPCIPLVTKMKGNATPKAEQSIIFMGSYIFIYI